MTSAYEEPNMSSRTWASDFEEGGSKPWRAASRNSPQQAGLMQPGRQRRAALVFLFMGSEKAKSLSAKAGFMRKLWGRSSFSGLERRGSESGFMGGGDFSRPCGRRYLDIGGAAALM